MNEKKFWKIVYLYVFRYGYKLVYYRPEKKDIWLLSEDNELLRLIYNNNLKTIEVDSIVSNIIKNELRLKKLFKLKSLKIKVLCVAEEFITNIPEYKKYKVSNHLTIERILFTEKYHKDFIRISDEKFINSEISSSKYKARVIESYKNRVSNSSFPINFKYNIVSFLYLFIYILNYMFSYFSNRNFIIYNYINYNYHSIIEGKFYRLFTSTFVVGNFKELFFILLCTFIISIIFRNEIKLRYSISVLFFISFIFNLINLFGYIQIDNVATVSYFGILGSLFLVNLNKRNNNLNFIFSIIVVLLSLLIMTTYSNESIIFYISSFIVGVFLQIIFLKKIYIYLSYTFYFVVILLGFIFILTNFDFRAKIYNYRLAKAETLLENPSKINIEDLENELNSKNKSVITYYELGVLKMTSSSINDSKKIFLEGIQFDSQFSPFYYQLALIERSESNYSKSREYIKKALELDSNNNIYKNLQEELNNK